MTTAAGTTFSFSYTPSGALKQINKGGELFEDYFYDVVNKLTKYYNYQKYRKSLLEKLDEMKYVNFKIYKIIQKCLFKSPGKRYDINELYNEIIILKNEHNSHNFHNDHK